jgi:hypothetical protein
MRRRSLIALLAITVAAAGLVLVPTAAIGEGANVISNGTCGVTWYGSVYQGTNATYVQTKKGRINASCHAVLVDGDPVETTTRIEFNGTTPYGPVVCKGTLTPSGNGNFSCKG